VSSYENWVGSVRDWELFVHRQGFRMRSCIGPWKRPGRVLLVVSTRSGQPLGVRDLEALRAAVEVRRTVDSEVVVASVG
jgi:hypothetical protein